MESNPAEELASLKSLQSTTRREVERSPRWKLPVVLVSVALFLLAHALPVPGFERFVWLIWIPYVWGIAFLARRGNRAKARREHWVVLAVMVGLITRGLVLAAGTSDVVGGIAGGLAGLGFGLLAVWRERRE